MKKYLALLTAILCVNYAQPFALSEIQVSGSLAENAPSATGGTPMLDQREMTLVDHLATVYKVTGAAQILKKDSPVWKDLQIKDVIAEGDQIKTSKDSMVELYYDSFYLNYIRIDSNTLASFDSIEPTNISMMEGNIFNMLDGLPKGTPYEVSTPKAVASVRGTNFSLGFDPANQVGKTSVEDGVVQMFPFIDDQKNIRAEKAFTVREEEILDLDHSLLRADKLDQSKPRKMEDAEKIAFEQVKNTARGDLINAIGGSEVFWQSVKDWKEIQNDEEKMALLQTAIKERLDAGRLKTHHIPFKSDEDLEAEMLTTSLKATVEKKKETNVVVSSAVVNHESDTHLQDSLIGASETGAGDADQK